LAIVPTHAIDATAVHAKVELIGVAIGGLAPHGFETVLFTMVILGTETVVGFLLEEAEMGAGLRLGTLLVGDAFDGIAKGGHGGILLMRAPKVCSVQ
jgi:hypothetical protein